MCRVWIKTREWYSLTDLGCIHRQLKVHGARGSCRLYAEVKEGDRGTMADVDELRRDRQEDEFAALQSIYSGDVVDLRKNDAWQVRRR